PCSPPARRGVRTHRPTGGTGFRTREAGRPSVDPPSRVLQRGFVDALTPHVLVSELKRSRLLGVEGGSHLFAGAVELDPLLGSGFYGGRGILHLVAPFGSQVAC